MDKNNKMLSKQVDKTIKQLSKLFRETVKRYMRHTVCSKTTAMKVILPTAERYIKKALVKSVKSLK